jgi:hypothetical protein
VSKFFGFLVSYALVCLGAIDCWEILDLGNVVEVQEKKISKEGSKKLYVILFGRLIFPM